MKEINEFQKKFLESLNDVQQTAVVSSFNDIVDTFYFIDRINAKYTDYTGFDLEEEIQYNLLDSY